LTLLRAIGWRSRADLRSRTAAIGKPLATPDAQCLQTISAEYALRPLPTGDPTALLQAGQLHNAPLQAFHYQDRPPRPVHSYLSVESSNLILTALKPPSNGNGWIVRLFNPTNEMVNSRLQTPFGLKAAQVVSMAEVMRSTLTVEGGNHVSVTVEPQEILTLRLEF
jgi:alpha-mannosidase